MKKTQLFIFLFSICSYISAQDFTTDFLDNHKERNEDFSVINVTSSMLKMVMEMEMGTVDDEFKSMLQDLKGIRILTTEDNGKEYYDSARDLLVKQHEELVSVDKSAKNVRIFTKNTKNKMTSEVIMLMLENDKMTLVDIIGNINLDKLSELSKIVNRME
ncbi:MAG: DUF4252 domain-containing protein [Candidatus Azobacteroides sp.]|nr:DUF4252 domain-containing protein [Candidatus Azobacteroides sp.]